MTSLEDTITHLRGEAARLFGGETVAKAFGAAADPMAGGQTVTINPDDPEDDPGNFTTWSHESETQPLPERHLACTSCGHSFRVSAGEAALKQKRKLAVGVASDSGSVADSLKNLNRGNGHDRLR